MQLDSIYLDFSKAFDRVSHPHLLAKLTVYDIAGSLLAWLQSFLIDRRLSVKFAGFFSSEIRATSGVPQGSHLGPLLFNVFVNDIVNFIGSPCLLFADDIKLFRRVSTLDDCLTLQRSLQCVETWCMLNSMELNVRKCFVISYHRIKTPIMFKYKLNDEELDRTTSAKDLGVLLTPSLNSDLHIQLICSKAYKSLGLIRRSFPELQSLRSLKLLYSSLVRPILEYCSVVWSPHQITLKNEIEKVQRRFLRMVGMRQGLNYREVPVDLIADILDLEPLSTRRDHQDIFFLHKLLNNHIDSPELLGAVSFRCSLGTRSTDIFWRRYVRTSYEFNSTLDRIQRLGNEVSSFVDFFNPSIRNFKRSLRRLPRH